MLGVSRTVRESGPGSQLGNAESGQLGWSSTEVLLCSLVGTALTFCFAAFAEMISAKRPKIRPLSTKPFFNITGKEQVRPKPPDVSKKKTISTWTRT